MAENENALLSFRTKNARSYRDEAKLIFDALGTGNQEVVRELEPVSAKPLRILPVAVLYGANASGKTAFLRAMNDMRETVLRSFSANKLEFSLRYPFLLRSNDEHADSSPTEFSVELLINGIRWQYGFSVSDTQVLTEFAYNYPRGRPKLVFDRDGDNVQIGRQFAGVYKAIAALIHSQALMLSIIGAISRSESGRVTDGAAIRGLFNWFTENLELLKASNRKARLGLAAALVSNASMRDRVLQFLRAADLGVTNLVVEKLDDEFELKLRDALLIRASSEEDEDTGIREVVKLEHRGEKRNHLFDPIDESAGTRVWLGLIGSTLQALDNGSVLLVDELDTSLHPHLVRRFVEIFQNPSLNPNFAQMVFNAHDTELLNDHERFALGRDQVWFAEKSGNGETHLFPLSEFRGRREDLVGKRYLAGRYGALPFFAFSPVDEKELE